MKRGILGLLVLFTAGLAFSQSLDTLWIIREDTGSRSTMERLDNPDLSPGMTIEVYIEKKNLTAKWGEGYVTYTYSYYSEAGQKIWTSDTFTEKKPVSGNSWTFARVHRVTLPGNISRGAYRLGFDVTDYHANKLYKGNVNFSIGMTGSGSSTPVPRPQEAMKGSYVCPIEHVEFSLLSVEKNANRLTLVFQGVNTSDTEEKLVMFTAGTRIISRDGEEFLYSDLGGRTNLSSGISFPPGVPMRAELYFKSPVTKLDQLSLLEIAFYYTDDRIELRNIPVPWHLQ